MAKYHLIGAAGIFIQTEVTNIECVFWDFHLSGWSDEGCFLLPGLPVTCECNHLTNFAILVVSRICFWKEITYVVGNNTGECIFPLVNPLLNKSVHVFMKGASRNVYMCASTLRKPGYGWFNCRSITSHFYRFSCLMICLTRVVDLRPGHGSVILVK